MEDCHSFISRLSRNHKKWMKVREAKAAGHRTFIFFYFLSSTHVLKGINCFLFNVPYPRLLQVTNSSAKITKKRKKFQSVHCVFWKWWTVSCLNLESFNSIRYVSFIRFSSSDRDGKIFSCHKYKCREMQINFFSSERSRASKKTEFNSQTRSLVEKLSS